MRGGIHRDQQRRRVVLLADTLEMPSFPEVLRVASMSADVLYAAARAGDLVNSCQDGQRSLLPTNGVAAGRHDVGRPVIDSQCRLA